MDNSWFFYSANEKYQDSALVQQARELAPIQEKQVYIINRPLNDSKYYYDYEDVFVVMVPGHKISFINLGEDEEGYEIFYEDFLEDLGSLADKYRHREYLGRPRNWKRDGLVCNLGHISGVGGIQEVLDRACIEDGNLSRRAELLISLITGSVNDIEKVGVEQPVTTLEKIKKKILLFDGEQTRFVYQPPKSKVIRIQGMSGAGKTELLLHKLKEIYGNPDEPRVMFTCHNKILASSLRERIPEFFNFMRVDQQIAWNSKLWCVHGWGSSSDMNSGAYRYICGYYRLPFHPWSKNFSFDDACKQALSLISEDELAEKGFCFDYMLIDESQDFPESFFLLAEKVTKSSVYIAGDVFQSIFDKEIAGPVKPDFLLRKCYRTDPRTLMFSHGLGTGMFEEPKLTWLEKEEWEACGYQVEKDDNHYILKREPVRRFEDVNDENLPSVSIVECDSKDDFASRCMSVIKEILMDHPAALPEDIGVMFYHPTRYGYSVADKISTIVGRDYGWEVNKAYETKSRGAGELFVSNQNNVKGLEFPFVICFVDGFSRSPRYRNALYMMLTRSFIKTYLVVSKGADEELVKVLGEVLGGINENGTMRVSIPSDLEKEKLEAPIKYDADSEMSLHEMVEDVCLKQGVNDVEKINEMRGVVNAIVSDYYDRELVERIVSSNKSFL